MWQEVVRLIMITFLPFLELRASIPYGIFHDQIEWWWVVLICIVTNIVVGIIAFFALDQFVHIITRIKAIDKIYQKTVLRTQRRIEKGIEKYGEMFLIIFIGIPLPGSGVYSGALAGYLMGVSFRKFMWANVFGVLIAATIVTIVSLTGSQTFHFLIKEMR